MIVQSDYRSTVVVKPTALPLTLTQAKQHLRVDIDDDDLLISLYLEAATQWCEEYVSGAFMTQTIRQDLPYFSDITYLFRGPVQSISSIKYIDNDDVLQTLATNFYNLDSVGNPARISLQWDERWPTTVPRGDAVQITYVAGYPEGSPANDPQNVPSPIRAAILMVLGDLYEHRENTTVGNSVIELPLAAKMLLQPYRLISV